MAATVNIASDFSEKSSIHSPKFTTMKSLSESGLTSIPSSFVSKSLQDLEVTDTPEGTIPIIDFSLLTSSNTEERCKVIQELGKACEEWGFFMIINHGIPESLINSMMEGVKGFFNLSDEEKREFQGKHFLDPMRCGSSFNTAVEKVHCWRDFLKVFVHPEFHFPHKPVGFSDAAFEYFGKIREVTRELLKGVSESLGLEPNYLSNAVNHDSSFQVFIANLYPPCPQPELAVGIHPHSDHGLLTIISENGIGGLQTLHNGKWVKVNALPNALMVNTADQLEIVTNGKYKSNVHRAALYSNATRITMVTANGPSLNQVISPISELVNEIHPPAYASVTYRKFYEIHQGNLAMARYALQEVIYLTLTGNVIYGLSSEVHDSQMINHGIPESLINSMMEGVKFFFNLSDKEKREFQGKHIFDPMRCGSSFNMWRRCTAGGIFSKFLCIQRDTAFEYTRKITGITRELLEGVSESLGLEPNYISKALNLDSGFQISTRHVHSQSLLLLTIVLENGTRGLQTLYNDFD